MEITVEKLKNEDMIYEYEEFSVNVDGYRILTIFTDNEKTATKWLQQVLQKKRKSNTKHGGSDLVVGVCAHRLQGRFRYGTCYKEGYAPYHLLQLCIGSHSLIFDLGYPDFASGKFTRHNGNQEEPQPKALHQFLEDDRVKCVGVKMTSVAKILDKYQNLKIKNPVDLNAMAEDLIPKDFVNMSKYGVDELAREVFGRSMKVVRPVEKLDWYEQRGYYCWRHNNVIEKEMLKFATVDAYLCFLLGCEFLNWKKNNNKNKTGRESKQY